VAEEIDEDMVAQARLSYTVEQLSTL